MKNYVFVGPSEKELENRFHFKDLSKGFYNFVVVKTLREAEDFANRLTDREQKDYQFVLNMNVFDREEVNKSGLLKKFDPRRIILSYRHPVCVPVEND